MVKQVGEVCDGAHKEQTRRVHADQRHHPTRAAVGPSDQVADHSGAPPRDRPWLGGLGGLVIHAERLR